MTNNKFKLATFGTVYAQNCVSQRHTLTRHGTSNWGNDDSDSGFNECHMRPLLLYEYENEKRIKFQSIGGCLYRVDGRHKKLKHSRAANRSKKKKKKKETPHRKSHRKYIVLIYIEPVYQLKDIESSICVDFFLQRK